MSEIFKFGKGDDQPTQYADLYDPGGVAPLDLQLGDTVVAVFQKTDGTEVELACTVVTQTELLTTVSFQPTAAVTLPSVKRGRFVRKRGLTGRMSIPDDRWFPVIVS